MTAHISTLPNGLTVASLNMPGAHSVNVGVWIKAGGRDELAGENGIAHMLEHMAFKGTQRRSAKDIAVEGTDWRLYECTYSARRDSLLYPHPARAYAAGC